ncbi:MAG: efflux RND transporter permease subunit, partial [Pseudomonadota bacterium]
MAGMVAWFARNSVAANLLMVVAFFGGVFSYFQMEREMIPAVTVNGATINMTWQGSSPQDVEDQIVTRLEEAIADIDGLDRITSIAFEGGGQLIVFGRQGTDMDRFFDEVQLRVDQINNFPPAAFEPRVQRLEQRNWYFGMAVYGDVDAMTMKRVADKIRDDIATMPGGDLARLGGVLREEVSIEVTETALRRYNISLSEIAQAVAAGSINSSGGVIRSPVGEVSVTTRNQAQTAEDFENIIIRQRTSEGAVRISDVATVIDGFADADLDARYNGVPTAFIFLPEPNVMDIGPYTQGFRDYIDCANDPSSKACENLSVQPDMPEAMTLQILWDDSEIFDARMSLIAQSAALGAILVCIVLILFLRPIVAFWVTVGIITAFAGGIMLLPLFGVSWNILSTFAVLLVIGVIVDDAIVVGENIHKEVESGRREGVDAAIVGTQLVLKPVVFGVITTIVAFLPWAFLEGPVRSQTVQISFVVVAALIFSIIECMFILPAHLAHMKKQEFEGNTGTLMRFQRRIADSLLWFAANVYKPTVELAIRFRYATVALFGSLLFLAISATYITKNVKAGFMPEIEAGLIQVTIELPDGTPFSRTLEVRDQLANGVELAKVELAQDWPDAEADIIDGISTVAETGSVQAWISVIAPEVRPEIMSTKDISDKIRLKMGPIQDAEEITFDFTQNEASNSVQFTLNHPNLDRLREASMMVQSQLSTYPNVFDIGDNLTAAAEELQISLKPGAEALDLTIADVARQLRQSYFGEEVQRFTRNGEEVTVFVRFSKQARESLDSVDDINIRIREPNGEIRQVPITQVANFSYEPGINQIVRRDRVRSVRIYGDVQGGESRETIIEDMNDNFWPEFERLYPDITRGYAG